GPRAQGRGPDEHPVRGADQRRGRGHDLPAGSEPARLAYGALRVQGHRHAAGQDRGALHGRAHAGRPGATAEVVPGYYSVKEAIFPFAKFQGVDPILGPEMRSTGEVMGVGQSFGAAFARAQEAAGIRAPTPGKAFVSVRDPDKKRLLPVAHALLERGFSLVATTGTAAWLSEHGVACEQVNKVAEGRPHIVDLIKNGDIAYIVNTTEGRQ